LEGHEDEVTATTFIGEGTRIVSGSRDDTIRVWDAATGAAVAVLDAAADDSDPSVMASAAALLAIGFENGDIQLRDTESHEIVRVLGGHDDRVSSLAFSSDDRWLASASEDDSILVGDLATGEVIARLSSVDPVLVAFSGDGTRLFAGEADGTVKVWETSSFEFVIALPTPAVTSAFRTLGWGASTSRSEPAETRIGFVSNDLVRLLRLESR
jgi:WD40 repeat protein